MSGHQQAVRLNAWSANSTVGTAKALTRESGIQRIVNLRKRNEGNTDYYRNHAGDSFGCHITQSEARNDLVASPVRGFC